MHFGGDCKYYWRSKRLNRRGTRMVPLLLAREAQVPEIKCNTQKGLKLF